MKILYRIQTIGVWNKALTQIGYCTSLINKYFSQKLSHENILNVI